MEVCLHLFSLLKLNIPQKKIKLDGSAKLSHFIESSGHLAAPCYGAFDFAPDNSQPAIETTDELRHRYGHAMGLVVGVSMGWSVDEEDEEDGYCSSYPLVNVYITMENHHF